MPIQIANPLELYAVDLINAERADAGLRPVHTEVHLNSAAQSHANWMSSAQSLSHTGANGSSATDRIEASDFPLKGATWNLSENLAYNSIGRSLGESDIEGAHAALMNSPSHKENILDPDVNYVGVGMALGQVDTNVGAQDVVYITQNFANTSKPVQVQEEKGGKDVITTYVNGEPVPGTSEPIGGEGNGPKDDDTDQNGIPDHQEDDKSSDSSGGSCFVATAAYNDRLHPDVVALRRFRDQVLVRYAAGRSFIRLYWKVGPVMAKFVRAQGVSGRLARLALRPLVIGARKIVNRPGATPRTQDGAVLGKAWRASTRR